MLEKPAWRGESKISGLRCLLLQRMTTLVQIMVALWSAVMLRVTVTVMVTWHQDQRVVIGLQVFVFRLPMTFLMWPADVAALALAVMVFAVLHLRHCFQCFLRGSSFAAFPYSSLMMNFCRLLMAMGFSALFNPWASHVHSGMNDQIGCDLICPRFFGEGDKTDQTYSRISLRLHTRS